MTTFLCTLGGSWAVIPEILGYVNPEAFPVYPEAWWQGRTGGFEPVHFVWAVTTAGRPTDAAVEDLCAYWQLLRPPAALKVFRVEAVPDLTTSLQNDLMAEALYRLALKAAEGEGPVYYSVAGGRKTMSSLLQKASATFGAENVFHVVSNPRADRATGGKDDPDQSKGEISRQEALAVFFERGGLPQDIAECIHPVALGGSEPFEGLFWDWEGYRPLRSADYPTVTRSAGDPWVELLTVEGATLYEEVENRRREAGRVSQNYFSKTVNADQRGNFRSLYRLKASEIEALRRGHIGTDPARAAEDLAWLQRLPKADLHCHLGGVASPEELPEIARASLRAHGPRARVPLRSAAPVLRELEALDPGAKRDRLKGLKRCKDWVRGASRELASKDLATAALIEVISASPAWLDALCRPEIEKSDFVAVGIGPYMGAGWLQGSSLLQTREAIAAACRLLYRKAAGDGVAYLEVRCSPCKYTAGGLTPWEALAAIRQGFLGAAEELPGRCRVELLLIGTRQEKKSVRNHSALALKAREEMQGSPAVLGFDIAGDEATRSPAQLRAELGGLFRECLKLTIHAGETEPVKRVWEAVYHLNADRIGHGLKLARYPKLLEHFRDRGTALELCPSSNDQVVGFMDHWRQRGPQTPYPLKDYLERGLRVCVCTDNPGISRTTWSGELLKAARMTPGGLSKWEILTLVYTGFQAAFLPQPERAEVMKEADEAVFRAVAAGAQPERKG